MFASRDLNLAAPRILLKLILCPSLSRNLGAAFSRKTKTGCLSRISCNGWISFATIACVALAGATLSAQSSSGNNQDTSLKSLTLEQLGNVEVTTVSKEPQEVWNTPAAIYVITAEDIRRSGAQNIPEALRLAPGVEVARITSGEYAIGIRGFNSRLSRSVLVLIDGRTVYTTFTAGTYWETQSVLMEDIDRIEVIRGPGGTIWGPNAVNGVINIITKKTEDTERLLGRAGGGNVERVLGDVRYGAGTGKGLAYRVYATGFAWAPQYHSDGNRYDDWHGAQGGFRLDWTQHGHDSFRLMGDAYRQSFGERVINTTYNPPANTDVTGDVPLYGGDLLWNWTRVQGEGRDIQVAAYYAHDTRKELNFGDIRNTFNVDFLDRLRFLGQEISWGGTLRVSHGDEIQAISGLTFTPMQRTDTLYQGLIQDEIPLVKNRLSLVAGTKVLKTNYTGVLAEPSGRMLYTPTATQTLWAAYTHALRTPADVERDFNLSSLLGYAPDGLPYFARFSANPNFRSEQLNGYEAGYRGLEGKNLYLDIATFYNHYGDLFSEDLLGPPTVETSPAPTHLLLPAQFGNGLIASTTGGEIAPEWRPKQWWRLRGSYSFLDMHVKKGTNSLDIGSAPTVQGSSPQHQILIQNGLALPMAINFGMQVRYVSSLPGIKVPSYWTGDATGQWAFTRQFRLTVVGQNLFQPHHVEFNYDPGPPVGIRRGLYATLTFNR